MKISNTLCAPSLNTLIHLNSINMYATTQETLSKEKIYSYKLSKSFFIHSLTHKYIQTPINMYEKFKRHYLWRKSIIT
jgi:hypothetical protein